MTWAVGPVGRLRLAAPLMLLALAIMASARGDESDVAGELRRDVLYLRSGEAPEGELQGCSEESCTLGGRSHARTEIVMIGLGVAITDGPPPIGDAFEDAVNPRGTADWRPGRLLGIDVDTVTTEQGTQARATIAWVYLAPVGLDQGGGGQSGAPTDEASEGGEPGALWTGRIDARSTATTVGVTTTVTITVDPVRLRDVNFPLWLREGGERRRIGTFTRLDAEGTVMSQMVAWAGECTGGGQGLVTLESSGSAIWLKTEGDTTTLLGVDIPEGQSIYAVGLVGLTPASHRVGTDCGTTSTTRTSPRSASAAIPEPLTLASIRSYARSRATDDRQLPGHGRRRRTDSLLEPLPRRRLLRAAAVRVSP